MTFVSGDMGRMGGEAHFVFDLLVFIDFFGDLDCFCGVFYDFVLRLEANLEYSCISKAVERMSGLGVPLAE